jgi:NADH-quinone oxidoreductase subunit H
VEEISPVISVNVKRYMLKHLFNFMIFPGFLFTSVIGLAASWIDRKITARLQWRVGPPWYQPLADIAKLSFKKVSIPKGAEKVLFFIAPFAGLSAAVLASTFVWLSNMESGIEGFSGDIIVVVYLLTLPAVSLMLGALSSRNPLAYLGMSREIKLILAYELPFIIAIIVPILKSGGILKLEDLILYQETNGSFVSGISGLLAFFVVIMCAQAKMGLVPFDMGEAETEIMGGTYIEYSGFLLAVFKLTKAIMIVVLPVFLVTLFWGGFSLWKYLFLLLLIILIRNTNPRVRIDQAMRFFWGRMTFVAVIAVVFAAMGK